jgi:hypothetical protein
VLFATENTSRRERVFRARRPASEVIYGPRIRSPRGKLALCACFVLRPVQEGLQDAMAQALLDEELPPETTSRIIERFFDNLQNLG